MPLERPWNAPGTSWTAPSGLPPPLDPNAFKEIAKALFGVGTLWQVRLVSMNTVNHEPLDPQSALGDVHIERHGDVSVIVLNRPPHNFLDVTFLTAIVDALESSQHSSRALVIASSGKSFCAGANFTSGSQLDPSSADKDFQSQARSLYRQAERLFRVEIPIICALDGPAVGAGLGIALACDIIVMGKDTWMSANFVKLGIHPGFAISHTLGLRIGPGKASEMLLTGKRVTSVEAMELGLIDRLVGSGNAKQSALEIALEIAKAAPLAVSKTRATLRSGLADQAARAMEREVVAQAELVTTQDCFEGISAMLTKREPRFEGR